MSEETQTVEGELVNEQALRRPSTPTTVNELATLEGQKGLAIVEQRLQIFQNLRIASIQLTMPNDYVLFNADGRVTAFLSDSGCDRIKKLWGISVTNLGKPERIEAPDGTFAYRITGDGTCGLTGEAVFDMEGVRYSDEDYARQKAEGIQREVAVQKAARANLDGGITRELAGLKSIPVEELDKAWEGSWKKSSMCSRGRGFGSKDQRMGRGDEKTGDIDPADVPICEVCKIKLVYRPNGKPPFWGCTQYAKHPNNKQTVNHDELLRQIADRKAAQQRQPGDEQ
jgi:hypothetical protein